MEKAPGGQGYSAHVVSAMNDGLQTIPLPPKRLDDLPVELNQFHDAAVKNRQRLDFDIEPSHFAATLDRAAKEGV